MLKRYDESIQQVKYTDDFEAVMEECVKGEYVKYSDIEGLLAAVRAIVNYHKFGISYVSEIDEILSELVELSNEFKKLEN